MPEYEYKCSDDACGYSFDLIQSISEKPIEQCPECKKNTAKRLISKTSFVLKGNGWFGSGGY